MIAGGGPATLGLLCNALKTNRLTDLVTPYSDEAVNGLAILEKGETLGGGCLQHYLINSNTSADGFMQCLYGEKSKKKEVKKSSSVEKKMGSSKNTVPKMIEDKD